MTSEIDPQDMTMDELRGQFSDRLEILERDPKCSGCGNTLFTAVEGDEGVKVCCALCQINPEDAPDLEFAFDKTSSGPLDVWNSGQVTLKEPCHQDDMKTVLLSEHPVELKGDFDFEDDLKKLSEELHRRGVY